MFTEIVDYFFPRAPFNKRVMGRNINAARIFSLSNMDVSDQLHAPVTLLSEQTACVIFNGRLSEPLSFSECRT